MKKALQILPFLLTFAQYSSAAGIRVGGSIGPYFVADSIYRDTYGSGSLIYAGSLSYDLSRHFEIRAEVGYFKDRGEMTLTREEINFSMIPLLIGVRAKSAGMGKFIPYLGAGVDFCSFKESARLGDTSGSSTGFQLEGGTYVAVGRGFFLDLNVRYVGVEAQPFEEKIKLGGWRLGVGVAYSF